MSNLIREVRVNKNGVPVVKHVRDGSPSPKKKGLLARLIPALNPSARETNPRREEITTEFSEAYVASAVKRGDRIEEYYGPDHARTDKAYVRRLLNRYSQETLDAIHAAYSGDEKLRSFLDQAAFCSENTIRSHALYRDSGLPVDGKRIIHDVAASIQIEDLTEFDAGSPEHRQISTVLSLATSAHNARTEKFYNEQAKTGRDWDYVMDLSGEMEEGIMQMNQPLAHLALEYPDRIQEIADYMADRDIVPDTVDHEHLRMHLENASPSLGSGVL